MLHAFWGTCNQRVQACFVRYADDFLVFTKTEKAAARVFGSVERYLTTKLKLVVNHDKSSFQKTEATEFLGYCFRGF